MADPTLCIDDALLEKDNGFLTHRYCCPIFICNQFGLLLQRDEDLVGGGGDGPKTRSGTLTLISHGGEIYGVTCRHVVEELEAQNEATLERDRTIFGDDWMPPPEGRLHFYVPNGARQIHINSKFHKAPGDAFTNTYPDVAIARLNPGTFAAIGKDALRICDDPTAVQLADSGLCGLATGFPENSRRTTATGPLLSKLSTKLVVAYCHFERISAEQVVMFAGLDISPEVDNLSGMSGGPILWSCSTGWGFAGIVKKGWDMQVKGSSEFGDPVMKEAKIWIEGERITRDTLISWLDSIPREDSPIRDLSKTLAGPGVYA